MADYLATQIPDVVLDALEDLVGKTKATELSANGLASLGKKLEDMELLEGWFGKIANRIIKTQYMIRVLNPRKRHILRDTQEWGAFIQRVYFVSAPDPADNPVYAAPSSGTYAQASPYDVEGSIAVQSLVYGGTGTWTLEFIRPVSQIRTAFTGASEMDAFIAALALYAENQFKLEEAAVENLAANTGIANAIKAGLCRNVLNDYNIIHDDAVITAEEALRNAEFHRMTAMTLATLVENMGEPTVLFNKEGYETFTDKDMLVVEVLAQYEKAASVYLQADTYHKELVELPNFEPIPFWQSPGSAKFLFSDCSYINIQHDDLAANASDTDVVEQGGIIAFLHDIEYVAGTFNSHRTWEIPNPRQDVIVHGEQANEGFAIDNFMNAYVLFMEDTNEITVSGGTDPVLQYAHAYAGVPNSITVGAGETATSSDVDLTLVTGTTTYTFTPETNAAITITVS